ncbi:MAG: glucosamine-6-phosphate deaminase [Zavarzinella sp.]
MELGQHLRKKSETERTSRFMAATFIPNARIRTQVFRTPAEVSRHAAQLIERIIREKSAAGRSTVLGLATGSTPVQLYRELIRLHREEGLDFSNVITFNLDEYFPMQPDDQNSYHRFMFENLFNHINIRKHNIHIPDGTISPGDAPRYCDEYEAAIRTAGGLDVQVLGIGRTGHIGFNEPGSSRNSRTRLVTLDRVTRRDAASAFFGEENVPLQAITMGCGTILDARQVILLAFGEHKASVVRKALEEPETEAIAASFLQSHQDARFLLDEPAAADLSFFRRPWEVSSVDWTPPMITKAVIWLSLKVGKSLLKLSEDDFRNHHLFELIREHGPAEKLGERVFNDREKTICHLPAGEIRKTVLVFSPHPDDDVISMGGTMIRLHEQHHKVHVAYMTSGNVAVFDHDARRFADFAASFNEFFNIGAEETAKVIAGIQDFLDSKLPGQNDSPDVLKIKSLIRETEARTAALACGIPPEQLDFLDLRFYRTGTKAKMPVQPEDIDDIVALLERLQPAQIYVAGELSDPHGTHRLCAEAIYESVRRVRRKGQQFEVWLYRGAWEEWEPHQIERAVPLSPETVVKKKEAIFRHQSQKDRAMFPGGSDKREFWQRAEERNRATAQLYDALGLPEFYALEAFVLWKDD